MGIGQLIKTGEDVRRHYSRAKNDKGPRTWWEDWVDKFMARINEDNEKEGFPLKPRGYFLKRLKGKDRDEVEYLYTACGNARSFGGWFNTVTKPKKV